MTPMRLVWKLTLSVLSWLIVMLIAAAAIELSFGRPRAGFVPLVVLVILVPVLFAIWRPRKRR